MRLNWILTEDPQEGVTYYERLPAKHETTPTGPREIACGTIVLSNEPRGTRKICEDIAKAFTGTEPHNIANYIAEEKLRGAIC